MIAKNILDDISSKISDVMSEGPVRDMEKNIKSIMSATFSKLDLVTREELEIQQQVLEHACLQIVALEERIDRLESLLDPQEPTLLSD